MSPRAVQKPRVVRTADGREIPSAAPVRECAIDDCRRAEILYAVGDDQAGDKAVELAIGMMRTAWRLDQMRQESTSVPT